MEIIDLKVSMSESSLANKIKSNEIFVDKDRIFSRIKYEKFLLENNLTAPDFERRLKKQELKKNLFDYVSGGIKSPYFLNNKIYNNETKQIELDYFDLNNSYDMETSNIEIDNFIKENEEKLKVDYIDLQYTTIDPKKLIEIDDFNDEFFKIIDEIENSILNGFSINEIAKKYNLTLVSKNNYHINEHDDEKLKEIYSKRNEDKFQLIDKNDYFLLFEIKKINKILPSKSDPKFIDIVKKNLILKKKFDLHQELFKNIQDKKLDDNKFNKIAKSKENILNIKLNGISDNYKFDKDSVKLIYSLPNESFTLITDENNKIYLAKIKNIFSNNLSKDNEKAKSYLLKSNLIIINDIFSSYNLSLNDKYNVKTYEQTMDRVKNYFK
tara:strand:- start:232 stop:1377 length:1146 start_codon:yes stop_codon:yes gene_type:complete